ncbi:MAG: hypothetical protein KGN84_13655 [Acidobacteriota bacterium]|nr:hypothetical protein [Acidobacteriota bacterium]
MFLLPAAGPSIRAAKVSPPAISAHRATAVLFTAEIADPAVIGKSVNLQRLNVADGTYRTIGILYDDGTHGDVTAGDGVYSLQLRLTEHGPFPLVFRISAAMRGSISRVFSPQIVVKEAAAPTARAARAPRPAGFSATGEGAAETFPAPTTFGF